VRAWIGIIADQPPSARALLLVLVLATLALYALGLASVVLAARLAAPPTRPEGTRPPALAVQPSPSPLATALPDEPPEATATPFAATPTPAATAEAQRLPTSTLVPSSPTPAVTPTRTATLEPTPTQDSAPTYVPPSEPTAPPRPTRQSPTSTPPRQAPAAPPPGTLAPGGTFARSEFVYPGDRSVYTVNLYVEPDDPAVLKSAGFIVYGPNGEEIVRGGAQPGKRPNVSANVITTRPGRYTVLIQNYHPSRAIRYRLQIITGPPPPRG
jgi:hypothetical protein